MLGGSKAEGDFSRVEMGRKWCGVDVEKEKFERFLEKRGRWEEKRGFLERS